MGRDISTDKSAGNQRGVGLPSNDEVGRLDEIKKAVEDQWYSLHELIITRLDRQSYGLKIKEIASNEDIKLMIINQHHNTIVFGVYGNRTKQRLLGFVIVYVGAPTIKWWPGYLSLSYSPQQDTRQREPKVLYDDEYLRVFRFGMGTFDYLFLSRKIVNGQEDNPNVQQALSAPLPDASVHKQFSGIWKDGM